MKMKNIISILMAFVALSLITVSCSKKEEKVVIGTGKAPVLTVNPNTLIVLQKDSDAVDAIKMSWTNADWGYKSALRYTVEAKLAGTPWSSAITLPVATDLKASLNHETLNQALTAAGVPAEDTVILVSRIRAEIPGTNERVYSNEVNSSVKTYNTAIVYPKMYLPGQYQGWAPSNADVSYLESFGFDAKFEGIFENTKPDGSAHSGEFKMAPQPNWDYDFGDNGSDLSNPNAGSGVIGSKAAGTNGNNFKLANETFLITVDTAALTWSYELASWGIIGTATPDGWNNDQNLRYDHATKTYSITLDLVDGQFKLRKNNAWEFNLGHNTAPDDGEPFVVGSTEQGKQDGKNWGITAGNYTIVLDAKTKKVTVTKN
jgi:starch-binding outer membrane protein SusE/F